MEFRNRRLTFTLLVASAILSPFIFFSSTLSSWENTNPVVMAIQEAVYPFEYAWHSSTSSVSSFWESYVALHDAADKNAKLRRRLAKMQARIMDYEEQIHENKRLRRLLGFKRRSEKRLIAAEVVGINPRAPFRALRVTRGRNDGVQVGMPVVAADGIVGRVIRAGEHFSDVQLLVDADFKLDVLLQRTRVRGVLSGAAQGRCELRLHRRVDISIGDTIITSGLVGGFPKGLPVGRIMRITNESDSVAQSITVEPWVDPRRLEEVMIIQQSNRELQKIVETAGREWLDRALRRETGG